MRGIDSNYGIEARRSGLGWTRAGRPIDPVEHLSAAGTGWIRIRVFTPHTTTNGLRYAGETALAAQRAGLTPFVSLFLTDRWATAEEQPVPQAWHRLTFPERVRAVREYAGMAAGYLKGLGVETDLFSIGNEIDYGVCGSYCEDQTKRESIWWMTERDDTWTRTAELILAGMEGVRSAYPRARFVAHLAHWFNPEFGVGFFRSMRAYGLRFDLIGASYYPTSGIPEDHFGTSNTFVELADYVDAVTEDAGLPLVFCEYGYPSTPTFGGKWGAWARPVDGYELSPRGQAAWLSDFLGWCAAHPAVVGAFYWSPEYYWSPDWDAFSLFHPDGEAKPALAVLGGVDPATAPASTRARGT